MNRLFVADRQCPTPQPPRTIATGPEPRPRFIQRSGYRSNDNLYEESATRDGIYNEVTSHF
jgi:hypothetical protein